MFSVKQIRLSKNFKRIVGVVLFFSISFLYFFFPFIANVIRLSDDYHRQRTLEELLIAEENNFFDDQYANLTCQFARLDPFDKTILDLVYHPKKIDCNQTQPFFTFLDDDGVLRLNKSEVIRYVDENGAISCDYQTFDRDADSEEDSVKGYGISGKLELDEGVRLDLDMVEVTCYNETGGEIYYDIHAHPVFPRMHKIFSKPTDDQLSVLLLMMDSTSISVLKRHLPKTYHYVKNVMKFKIFNGFHKIGDNSFPNMVAALTGYRYQYEQANMPPDIQEDVSEIRFDHWPFIWKEFSRKGYATIFNEDKAEWGLFRYYVKGFKEKPVDFYYHMYWYAVYLREYYTKHSERYCFQNYPKIVRFLDLVKRHVKSMQSVLQFQYAFLTDLCHEEDSSEEERADDYMEAFLKEVYENGYLNKTVVLFFSDHGHRYTPIRNTLVGLLEERTPMFNVWFPPWFYKKYPHIEENLRLNTVRLSTLYDVHETLHDIASANYLGSQRPSTNRGLSQLYPIPTNRTCFSAGVPDHHCTCVSMTPLDLNSTAVQTAALTLKDHINRVLSQFNDLCRQYTLKKIIRAERLNVNKKLAYGVARYQHTSSSANQSSLEDDPNEIYATEQMRVAVELTPMDAQFEAVMIHNATNDTYSIQGDISRLNKFGQQSYCAPKKYLQKFCVCIKPYQY